MSDLIPEKRKIIVIGHKNPDSDSICSAIGYAYLKNALNGGGYAAARTADVNRETSYVLNRFHLPMPKLFEDVSAQVQDIDIRQVDGVSEEMTMHDALIRMRDEQISTLPVISENGHLKGIVTINNLAVANMEELRASSLAKAGTPIKNIICTLGGTLVTGSADKVITSGKIVMGSSSPEFIETTVTDGDIVICGNRYDSQLCAIEMNAACIIICNSASVAKTIVRIAEEHGTTVISTPKDPFEVACTINQSVPVGYLAFRNDLVTFNLTDPLEEAREVMGRVRHVYFPVLDKDGAYCGMISRRNFLNMQRKRLILVDHNERSQCVDGYKEAEILEIIDHHRINSIETSSPVFFRNQAVGSTCTIVAMMFEENGVDIPADIAGALCAGVLSDTLMFRSPTCTPVDKKIAEKLAGIAGVQVEELANSMFEAGENIEGKTAEELFFQDFKRFDASGVEFGVGQGSYVSSRNLSQAEKMISAYMEQARERENLPMVYFLLTNIKEQSSRVLCCGKGAEELAEASFGLQESGGDILIPGLISRKKQFIPKMLHTIEESVVSK